MRQHLYRFFFSTSLIVFIGISVSAQKDTTHSKSVNITSAFKPVLRESAKINFNASPPTADTAKPKLQYDIPDPSLLLAYQPASLKPLALQLDSTGKFGHKNYIKAGFGSFFCYCTSTSS